VPDLPDSSVATVILCGGKGTRAYPLTVDLPKPMLPIGERPILGHVMDIYARQGFTRFVLAAGYLVEVIEKFVGTLPEAWEVDVVDTGEQTDTGDRIRRCAAHVGDVFFATYGDGLGNVDLHTLLARHRAAAALGTLTTVPLPSQYGTVDIDGAGRVRSFLEKPTLLDHWINAGFFVLEQDALAVDDGPNLESDLLPALAARSALTAYRHGGFWKSMDTHKDMVELSRLAEAEGTPWLTSPAPEYSSPAPPVSSART
jgi:glucose-1-phosphate cytidylyltransferase